MFIDIVPVRMVRVTGLDGGDVTVDHASLESGRVRLPRPGLRKSTGPGRVRFVRPVVTLEEFVEHRVVLCEADGFPERVAVVGPYDPNVDRRWVRFGIPAVWVR